MKLLATVTVCVALLATAVGTTSASDNIMCVQVPAGMSLKMAAEQGQAVVQPTETCAASAASTGDMKCVRVPVGLSLKKAVRQDKAVVQSREQCQATDSREPQVYNAGYADWLARTETYWDTTESRVLAVAGHERDMDIYMQYLVNNSIDAQRHLDYLDSIDPAACYADDVEAWKEAVTTWMDFNDDITRDLVFSDGRNLSSIASRDDGIPAMKTAHATPSGCQYATSPKDGDVLASGPPDSATPVVEVVVLTLAGEAHPDGVYTNGRVALAQGDYVLRWSVTEPFSTPGLCSISIGLFDMSGSVAGGVPGVGELVSAATNGEIHYPDLESGTYILHTDNGCPWTAELARR